MIVGYSDAKITVRKRGAYCYEQGILMAQMGDWVCPRVYIMYDDGYEMEMLAPLPERDLQTIFKVYERLRDKVWSRPCLNPHDGWYKTLLDWCRINESPWLLKPIVELYGTTEPDSGGYSLIHGDPTLANVMRRSSDHEGYMVIADPMGRYDYRREIPDRSEVDIGKMIQSAAGWEHVLGAPRSVFDSESELLTGLGIDRDLAARSMLWGAIHLARVARRAVSKGDGHVHTWALAKSKYLAKESTC